MTDSYKLLAEANSEIGKQYYLKIEKLEHVLEVLVKIISHWKGQRIGDAELRFVEELLEVNGIEIPHRIVTGKQHD